MASKWQDIAARKQKERQARIPSEWLIKDSSSFVSVLDIPATCGLLSQSELDITGREATFLLAAIASKSLTSEDVTIAFCKRAAIAQQTTNCLTEIFFEDGIARAKQMDDHVRRYGKLFGPLHGLPISLKDSFKVRGYDASLGVASLCFQPATTNSALVDLLLSMGAVLYCKTNIPQTLSSLDSHNNIFGRTLNPLNRYLTAGGSSGGEGALVAMRGSPLGIGTDIGGSIRVPAMCNGLVGFKPSHGRIPYAGQQGALKDGSNKISMEATAGPIARSVRDCAMFLQVIADNKPESVDSEVFAQTWQQQSPVSFPVSQSQPRLRVGVIRIDGHVTPLPPVVQLMDEVVNKLKPYIELVEVDASTLLSQCVKSFNGIMSIDGANAWFDLLEATREPLSPWLQGRLKRRAPKSTDDIVQLQAQRTALQTKFLALWQQTGGYWRSASSAGSSYLDVLICPAAPHPVAPIDGWNTVNYTSAWNLLDYPAGILPVRPILEQDIALQHDSKALNGWDKVNQELWTKVDKKVYLGSPLSIQVVAPRLQERKLIESMAVIADALQSTTSRSKL